MSPADAEMHARVRNLVEGVLRGPLGLDWTVQGLGMLRCYLTADRSVRLHVWDRGLVVPGASPVHTHPWDFTSYVVAGRVVNTRYAYPPADIAPGDRPVVAAWSATWNRGRLKCGEGAHIVATLDDKVAGRDVDRVELVEGYPEVWREGHSYAQARDEIHRSDPEDGTVTIVTRVFGPDPEHADVFWRGREGTPWHDAAPRPPEREEILAVCARSLEAWW